MERLDHNAQDRWICCLPLHHIGGLSILYRSARAGSCVDLQPRFDAAAVNASIDAGATIVSVVPTMLQRILDHRNDWPFPAHLRVILMGGAPASKALLDRCRAINAPVSLTWGMTETASQIATRAPGDLRQEPDAGHPLSGTSVHVEDGPLVVEGPIAPGGRLVTADRGHIDPQGRIVVTGRGHDLIISGGENIDPVRVEQALCSHEDVDAAAVVGRPDAEWGQRPVAFVTGRPSDTLEARMQSMLPAHERPAEIHWVDSLPRTELGKLKRSDLVDQANALHRLSKG